MYLSWLLIICLGALLYLIGFNKGKQTGRDEMQDELVGDPDLYARLKYADDELNEPLDDE